MSDEEREDEDGMEHDGCCVPSARFSRWDVMIAFFGMLMGFAHAVSSFFEVLLSASVAAANKEMQDDRFHQDAALEIETITGGTDG